MVLRKVLILAVILTYSWTVLGRNDGGAVTKNKYYINKKGNQVIEITPDGNCQIHNEENSQWMKETRKERMNELNYIQFRLMLGKCHLQSFFSKKPLESIHNRNANVSGHPPRLVANLRPPVITLTSSNSNSNSDNHDGHTTDKEHEDLEKPLQAEKVTPNEGATSNSIPTNGTEAEEEDVDSPAFPLIFPGTKWCGRGTAARGDHDLGIYVETDKCCREHDQCPESMASKECKFGLCNESEFTRSHCTCDESFLECLSRDRSFSSLASFKVANLYFNILKPFCYARRHPVKWCRSTRITGECAELEFDFRYPTVWQFFPAHPFRMNVVENLMQPSHHPPPGPPPPPPPRRPLPGGLPIPPHLENSGGPPHPHIIGPPKSNEEEEEETEGDTEDD